MKMALPDINIEKCTGCEDCVIRCPAGVVKLVDGKAVVVIPDGCQYCTDCDTVCLSGAIRCPFEIVLIGNEPDRSADDR